MSNCSLCGEGLIEVYIVPWAMDMGPVCKSCFDEIIQFPPGRKKVTVDNPGLQKAREVRSQKAQDKRELKEEQRQAKRDRDPEKYEATYQKRLIALQKARAARMANKMKESNYAETKAT